MSTCDNCGAEHGADDMFCESCGYDFVTGSLPDPDVESGPVAAVTGDGAPAAGPATDDAPTAVEGSPILAMPDGSDPDSAPSVLNPTGLEELEPNRLAIEIAVDRSFFDEVVNGAELDFPDPPPAEQRLELSGRELHIGRTSESRAIHPDVDVAALTGDQAVSSRHAILRVANDGAMTITDIGSTNGTFLAEVDADPMTTGIPSPLQAGVPIYLGAWTRLTVVDGEDGPAG